MSRIKSKDTKPELFVKKYLYTHGVRYRNSFHKLLGKPDIAIKKYKLILFVNGCFWHGHKNCKHFRTPRTNTEFWDKKIKGNTARDERIIKQLRNEGFDVYIIWECQINKKDFNILDQFIARYLALKSKNMLSGN